MVLLTGPAGSGKTFRILERTREALRRGDSGVRLLTPTATMAQHLQNRMAREGFVFRPSLIQTLSRFVDAFAADIPQVSRALFYLIVEEAAQRVGRPEFKDVTRLPGFCAALARTMEELSSAGCDAERLAGRLARKDGRAPLGEAFLAVYSEVDRELRRRGLATRSQRLLHAAEAMARDGLGSVHTIWLDGFYALPDPELAAIAAVCRHADVTLTLPDAAVTRPTRERLLAMGFVEQLCAWEPAPAHRELVAAQSIEREADEIARRILEQAASGRPFREMGVVVRSPEVYEAILRATLDRFGIPARFYFDADLERHAVVRFLSGVVEAMLGGWDHAETLAALRLAPGPAFDEFDFAVRERLPGAGLDTLQAIAAGRAGERAAALAERLQLFGGVDAWRALALAPVDWAARLQSLRTWFAPGWMQPGSYDAAAMGRGQAAALDLFDEAMAEAARTFPNRPLSIGEFWRAAKSVLRLTPLRAGDNRRNVVHVLDAHEARQWQLPVVFVCGLVEKQFPKFRAQDPFFPDAARAQLQQSGIRLRTAAEFETEERFLFDWAVTRATESLTLSYPRTDARGQQNLRSLYLEGLTAVCAQPAAPPRSAPPQPAGTGATAIRSPGLLAILAQRHQAFQPTSLEVYLQCPFQFFGRDTLRLRGAPLRPEKRLDYRTQGSIAHATLAAMHREGLPIEVAFGQVFERICKRQNVASGYRTECLRERMRADLGALVEDPGWSLGYQVRAEQEFQYDLDGVEIKGRIDRIDVTPDGGAYVIDYKYSGAQNTKSRASDQNLLQAQLYMHAIERCFHLHPEGMSYWGFKGGIQRTAWAPYAPAPAIETTLRIAGEIGAGQVAPNPADTDKCRLCDFRDACRFVAAESELEAEIADGASHWD